MFKQRIALRWGDYDALQHVNNVRYFEFMQDSRVGFIESLGIERGRLVEIGHVVAHAEIDYRKSIGMDAREVLVNLWIERVGGASYTVGYEFTDEAGTVYAEAKTVMVTMEMSTQTVVRIPDDVRAHLQQGIRG